MIKKGWILIFLTNVFCSLWAQEPNDCVNAITVCGNGTFMSNASGYGTLEFSNACGSYEHNSVWIRIDIAQSGTLGFDLIPNDPALTVDYDFWIFGPNRSCTNLGSPIRCATTNPEQAGLSNNQTGMNGTTVLTQTGPGNNGNGYVRWLDVLAGEYYYIIVDRPYDGDGFQIQWTGSATEGTGAFPEPPSANNIGAVKQCSGNPNVAVFDLNSIKSSINSNLTNNTVEFFLTLADATDRINPLPSIYVNSANPQHIYARVTSGTDCYAITEFDLIVSPIPTASIAVSDNSICEGENVTITITGTAYSTVHYNIDGNSTQEVTLDNTGTTSIVETPTANMTIQLENAQIINFDGTVVCSQPLTEAVNITITSSVTPAFTQVAPICSGETLSSLPTTSNNGVTGTWSPALNNTATTTYTFTPDAGQCAVTQTMEIIVNPSVTPTFTQITPICSGETLNPLPTTSNNGVTGTWSPVMNNTATTTYTFTPDAGQCAVTQTMEIIVNPNVTPTFTQIAPICSGETLNPLPTTSNNGVTGTWTPAINNTATTTYTFTPDNGQCAVTQTMEIIVNPSVTPTFTQIAPICSGETLNPLPTTSNNGVTGTWSPALNNTATTMYTFTPDSGQCAVTQTMEIIVNPSVTPTFTQIAPICSGGTLNPLPTTSNNGIIGTWSPALNNTATTTYTFTPNAGQCAATQSMQIVVNPIVTPTFTQIMPICSGNNLAPLPTTSNNGVTGTWSPVINNTATTTYTFTPDTGQCAVTQTMEIVVSPIVTPTFTQIAPICSGGTLSPLPSTSNNGVTGTWTPAINNTATTTYTFTPDNGQCALVETMAITIIPTPTLNSSNLIACSASRNGFYAFDLAAEISSILGASQPSSDYSVAFFQDSSSTIPITTNPFTNTTAYSQTIYVEISHNTTSCTALFPYELKVEDAATATAPNPITVCDDDGNNDGFYEFDLTTLETTILNGQNPADYQVSFYTNSANAQTGINPISNPEDFVNTVAYAQTIYIRVENIAFPDACFATTSVSYKVNPTIIPSISSIGNRNTLCVDYTTNEVQNQITLVCNVQGNNYQYTWSLNGQPITGATQSTHTINTASPGLYTVLVTEIIPVTNCNSIVSQPFEIIQSGQAVLIDILQTTELSSNPNITVIVDGYGDYIFQLDNGEILDNNGVFNNVSGGTHTIYVYDTKTENQACAVLVIEDIHILDYPKYFTPNGDNINDIWNIPALSNQTNASIFIFDRYGKLIKSIKPSGYGWDGTFNGKELPSTDYWFVVYYNNDSGLPQQFKAHFSLKR